MHSSANLQLEVRDARQQAPAIGDLSAVVLRGVPQAMQPFKMALQAHALLHATHGSGDNGHL